MRKNRIQYDDNGNFVFNGDLEVQWMQLHRDIQSEYRNEQWRSFIKGMLFAGGIVSVIYFALSALNHWIY